MSNLSLFYKAYKECSGDYGADLDDMVYWIRRQGHEIEQVKHEIIDTNRWSYITETTFKLDDEYYVVTEDIGATENQENGGVVSACQVEAVVVARTEYVPIKDEHISF
ncbi:hypothetical protein SEA_WEASELS2_175 [Rhodococcus phage Weasels2]|uniref:Uncharacterized protein n=1 Tax=Rhodococcus phage Weasels2 TaxID=1897437 RepID=A0A1I9SAE8_9CAUD|nr:hypothetical protein FDH04_gp240 [Rhodococcus phage Weasels2]AOZ63754.1 hypothetical protein SEA_WEASELS2_175 [Rhodococcus phage Weasels2]